MKTLGSAHLKRAWVNSVKTWGSTQVKSASLVDLEHSRSQTGKLQAEKKLQELRQIHFDDLDLERFKIIADWYHFSILELTYLKDFRSDPTWISQRLGISVQEAKSAIARLLKQRLLEEDGDKKLVATQEQFATPSGMPSRELRNHHSQILRKADRSLELVPVNERDFSSSTLAIDSSKIEEAKEALREFRRKFCNDINDQKSKDRVYCLAIQFFPTDQIPSNANLTEVTSI